MLKTIWVLFAIVGLLFASACSTDNAQTREVSATDTNNSVTGEPLASPLSSPPSATHTTDSETSTVTTPNISQISGTIYFGMQVAGGSQIFALELLSNDVRQITHLPDSHFAPAISPDGKLLAMAYSRNGASDMSDIAVMNLVTGDIHPVTNLGAISLGVSWMPNQDRLVFHSNKKGKGKFDIYTINLDGSDLTELKVDEVVSSKFTPKVTPDGMSVVYSDDRTGVFAIYSAPITGGTPQILAETPGRFEQLPTVSPDGKLLAFSSLRLADTSTVFIAESNGANAKAAFPLDKASTFASFSPDSMYIAASVHTLPKWEIMVTPVSITGEPVSVYQSLYPIEVMSWTK